MQEKHLHNVSGIIGFENARANRKAATAAEDMLWSALRGRNFLSLKFRRQHPIRGYIADFYCFELNLIIEMDGKYHQEQEQIEYDQERTKEFEAIGIKVMRLTNQEVHNTEAALAKIKSFIEDLKVPSPLGEG